MTVENEYYVVVPDTETIVVSVGEQGPPGGVTDDVELATLLLDGALTPGSVLFGGADGSVDQDNANFFWDDTNKRLGIGTYQRCGDAKR
jgi:hypothetical protein